jgi:hypothetical protein
MAVAGPIGEFQLPSIRLHASVPPIKACHVITLTTLNNIFAKSSFKCLV